MNSLTNLLFQNLEILVECLFLLVEDPLHLVSVVGLSSLGDHLVKNGSVKSKQYLESLNVLF